jgi:hypothetical protein
MFGGIESLELCIGYCFREGSLTEILSFSWDILLDFVSSWDADNFVGHSTKASVFGGVVASISRLTEASLPQQLERILL